MSVRTLDELLDERQIIELTYRYAWALDHRRFPDLAEVFTEDGVADYGALGVFTGPEAIGRTCAQALGSFDVTQHLCSNHLVQLYGDRGACRCYFQAQHTRRVAGHDLNVTIAGSYFDDVVRTPLGWRIARRSLRTSWTEGEPNAQAEPGGAMRTTFVIAGWIEVDAARRTELLEAAVEMMRATREEEGNLDYVFSADPAHPGRVRVFEQWRGESDLRGHFDTPHMVEFQKALATAGVCGRDLSRFEVSGVGPVFR